MYMNADGVMSVNRSATLIPPTGLPGEESCIQTKMDPHLQKIPLVCMGMSIVYVVLFSCLEKRSNRDRNQCTGNHPGIIIPVNLVHRTSDTLAVAAAFGSLTGICFDLFFTFFYSSQIPYWSQSLVLMLAVLSVGLIFYPLFASISTSWVLLGSIFGFCYSVLWLIYYIADVIYCPSGDTDTSDLPGREIARLIPVIACLFLLVIKFLVRMIRAVVHNVKFRGNQDQRDDTRVATDRNRMHVRLLLSSSGDGLVTDYVSMATQSWTRYVRQLFGRWVYSQDPTFEYSPRIICIFTVAILCAYQFGILIIIGTKQIHKYASDLNEGIYNASDINAEFFKQFKILLDTFTYSAAISFVLASLAITWSIFQILTSYRRNITRMYKGDFSGLPFTRHDRHSQLTMTDSLVFAGTQIGYTLWGYIIIFVVLVTTGIGIAYLIVLPLMDLITKSLLNVLANLLSGMLVSPAFYLLLMLGSRFLLQSRPVHDENGRERSVTVLAIDNRKVYHNVQYFLFFFNIVLGLFGCLLTILKGIVLGILYLPRLDRCGLISGYERWDTGYMYYVSLLHVEECHRHPVMLVFCDLLLDTVNNRGVHKDERLKRYGSIDSHSDDQSVSSSYTSPWQRASRSSSRARNRWLKAYTILRNPGVRGKDFINDFDLLDDSNRFLKNTNVLA